MTLGTRHRHPVDIPTFVHSKGGRLAVAQILSGDGSDAPATEVITVADLLSRHAPVPVQRQEPDTGGISVGALLRREGRVPHPDRLQLRPQPEAASGEGGTDRRVMVRRGAIAAGTLLAAGSVLGAAMLADVTPTANQTPATGGGDDGGPYSGQGLLDPEAPLAAAPDSVVIDQAAARDPLDPGAPPPSDWVPVAFPGALPDENSGTGAADGGDTGNGGSSGTSGDDSSRVAAAAGDDDEKNAKKSSTSSGSESSSKSSTSSDSGSPSKGDSSDEREDSGDKDDDGGGLLNDVGKTVGGAVDGVTGLLGLDGDSDSKKSESNNDGDDEDSKSSRMSLFSAGDEDSSAPRDEDDSESRDSAESSDSDDSEDSDSDDDGGDSDDDGGDGGLVSGLLGTVGGLLR
jgi:hypothetical protein